MKALYTADNEYICQVVNWPPRNTQRGWELDILCDPVLLREFQYMRYCTFRVDSIEFEGLEKILPAIVPEDEMAQVTLVFQYCVSKDEGEMELVAIEPIGGLLYLTLVSKASLDRIPHSS